MKSYRLAVLLSIPITIIYLHVTPPIAKAYSIGPSGPSTTDLNNISQPFKDFIDNLNNISSSDLPDRLPQEIMHPTTQSDAFSVILHFLSVATEWLIGISNQVAVWVIGMIQTISAMR